jgi:hypothetical protein
MGNIPGLSEEDNTICYKILSCINGFVSPPNDFTPSITNHDISIDCNSNIIDITRLVTLLDMQNYLIVNSFDGKHRVFCLSRLGKDFISSYIASRFCPKLVDTAKDVLLSDMFDKFFDVRIEFVKYLFFIFWYEDLKNNFQNKDTAFELFDFKIKGEWYKDYKQIYEGFSLNWNKYFAVPIKNIIEKLYLKRYKEKWINIDVLPSLSMMRNVKRSSYTN